MLYQLQSFLKGMGVLVGLLVSSSLFAQEKTSLPFQTHPTPSGNSFQTLARWGAWQTHNNPDSGLYAQSFLPDAVLLLTDSNYAAHEIRYIPNQSGIAGSTNLTFYVKCDSLPQLAGQAPPRFSMTLLTSGFGGIIKFNARNRMFSVTPLATDTTLLQVLFRCIRGNDTIQQIVKIQFSSPITEEENSFGLASVQTLPLRSDRSYTIISPEVSAGISYFNGSNRALVDITISGLDLVVDNNNGNVLSSLNGRNNIRNLTIYADRLLIKRHWELPGTNLNIYCREIRFEDSVSAVSFINTKPLDAPASFQTPGRAGQKGGNITIYTKKLSETGNAFRFFLGGGKGGDAGNATSGGGGAGGDFFSNIPLFAKVDNWGNTAGISNGGSTGMPLRGDKGAEIQLDSFQNLYLHPFYLKLLVAYWNDAYYLGKQDSILPEINQYLDWAKEIASQNDFGLYPSAFTADLNQFIMEAEALNGRILSRLDFFGNPAGWAPMLSFEFTKQAFDSELNHSIRMMYLNYFINRSANVLQGQLAGLNALSARLQNQAGIDQTNFNDLVVNKLPSMGNKIEESKRKMEQLEEELKKILDRKQKDAARKAKWIGIAKTIGSITSLLPIPGAQIIGPAITAGASLYDNLSNQGNINLSFDGISSIGQAIDDGFKQYKELNAEANESKIKIGPLRSSINDFFPTFSGGLGINNLKNIVSTGSNVVKEANAIIKKVSTTYKENMSATKAAVEKAKSEQFAQYPELLAARQAVEEARIEHEQMVKEYNAYNDQSLRLSAEIAANALAYDHARTSATAANVVIDHRAVQYIDQLTRGCINRLRKYHYYMAKAFEYRTLQSYTGNLNIQSIINSAQAMADSASLQSSSGGQLTLDQFTALAALYEDQVRQIAESIYTFYTSNAAPQSTQVSYNLPLEDIQRLNDGDTISLNPVIRGFFPPSEENPRINTIRVSRLVLKPISGTIGSPAQVDVNIEVSNESKTRKNGKQYYFNNYNLNTQTPLYWRSRLNVSNQSLTDFKPSVRTASFLSALLTNSIGSGQPSTTQLFYYSQPLADAEYMLSMQSFNNNGSANFQIDSCTITLEYDVDIKGSNFPFKYLDIRATPEWIVPEYRISRVDINSRKDGQGKIMRAYNQTNPVQVSAQTRIGKFRFERWLTQNGANDISADSVNATRSFFMNNDRSFIAKYKYAGPIMKVPDTLVVRRLNEAVTVQVANVGEDQGMEWFVDSSSTGLTLSTAVPKGIDNGSFSFSLTDTLPKFKYLFFASPDAQNGFDTTVIVYRKPDMRIDTLRRSFCFGGTINLPGIGVVSQAGAFRDTLPGDSVVNLYLVTTNPLPNPQLNANNALTFCAGASGQISVTNTQPDWSITWFKDGVQVGNGPQFPVGSVQPSSNAYYARVTNVLGCVKNSDTLQVIIAPVVVPAVSISSNLVQNSGCSGSPITFTALPQNGGSTPTYTWFRNGSPIPFVTTATYTSSSLFNNDQISVRLTANNQCQTTALATSNSIVVNLQNPANPNVSIATASLQICQNAIPNITINGMDLGSSPRYFWYRNGILVDTASTFNFNGLNNGDTLRLRMRTFNVCQLADSISSNPLVFNVSSNVTPAVSFNLPTNALCSAKSFTFVANPVNGGSSPVFEWKRNNVTVFTGVNYVYSNPTAGDLISVEMTANNQCQTRNKATSNLYQASVIQAVSPSVSFSNLPSQPLCSANSFVYQANPLNAGSNPIYQWRVDGVLQASNTSSFVYASPSNGQQITVSMLPNNACQTADTVTISTTVQALAAVTPSVSVSSNTVSICEGTAATITAAPINGGSSPVYIWEVNGQPQPGISSSIFTNSNWSPGARLISVRMVANNSCQTVDTVTSTNNVSIVVNPIPAKPIISRSGATLQSSSSTGNQWFLNGQPISGANNAVISPVQFGSYTVSVTINGCTSPISDTVLFIPTELSQTSISSWQYFPNPASESVMIRYQLESASRVSVYLTDMSGRIVKRWENGVRESGSITDELMISDVAAGLYLLRIETDDHALSGKLQISR